MKHLWFLSILLFITGCTDFDKADQLEKINSLQVSLNEANENYLAIDLNETPKLLQEIDIVESRIKEAYQYDTLDLETAEKLDRYKTARIMLIEANAGLHKIPGLIKAEKVTLMNLKKDIETSAGKRTKYYDNIRFENEKVSEIISFTENCINIQTEGKETFHTLHDELQSFSIRLETENKEQ